MKKNFITLSIFTLLVLTITVSARPWRPGQIPNGSKFSCATCHTDPNGGGPRNQFGQAVESRVTVGGTEQFWGSALAALDSDGDGKTNGQELQDPSGAWRPGQADPGSFNLVSNPGNSLSVSISNITNSSNSYMLFNNYPNPFNPSTSISFALPKAARVSVLVFDMIGRKVAQLVDDEFKSAGIYSVAFNAGKLSSGTYLYHIETPEFIETKKMILLK